MEWIRLELLEKETGISMKTKVETRLVTTSQPSDWVKEFRKVAKSQGMTLSEWIGHVCLSQLERPVRQKLSKRVSRGRPFKDSKSSYVSKAKKVLESM